MILLGTVNNTIIPIWFVCADDGALDGEALGTLDGILLGVKLGDMLGARAAVGESSGVGQVVSLHPQFAPPQTLVPVVK